MSRHNRDKIKAYSYIKLYSTSGKETRKFSGEILLRQGFVPGALVLTPNESEHILKLRGLPNGQNFEVFYYNDPGFNRGTCKTTDEFVVPLTSVGPVTTNDEGVYAGMEREAVG